MHWEREVALIKDSRGRGGKDEEGREDTRESEGKRRAYRNPKMQLKRKSLYL